MHEAEVTDSGTAARAVDLMVLGSWRSFGRELIKARKIGSQHQTPDVMGNAELDKAQCHADEQRRDQRQHQKAAFHLTSLFFSFQRLSTGGMVRLLVKDFSEKRVDQRFSQRREYHCFRAAERPLRLVVHRPSASPTTIGGSGQSSVSQMARSSSASRTVTCRFARMQAAQATTMRRLMAGTD